jgi:hypothetical protein
VKNRHAYLSPQLAYLCCTYSLPVSLLYPNPTIQLHLHIETTDMVHPSDDNHTDMVIRSFGEQAVTLEKNYKEMLLQNDEVDRRIQLWRDVIEICKVESKSTSFNLN